MKHFKVSFFIVWFLTEFTVTQRYVMHYEKRKWEGNWKVEYTISIDASKVTILCEKQEHQEEVIL